MFLRYQKSETLTCLLHSLHQGVQLDPFAIGSSTDSLPSQTRASASDPPKYWRGCGWHYGCKFIQQVWIWTSEGTGTQDIDRQRHGASLSKLGTYLSNKITVMTVDLPCPSTHEQEIPLYLTRIHELVRQQAVKYIRNWKKYPGKYQIKSILGISTGILCFNYNCITNWVL